MSLAAGAKTVRLGFLNDFWDPETQADRNLILDEVIVRDQAGEVVEHVELENLDSQECMGRHWNESRGRFDGYVLYCQLWLDVPVSIPADGDYRIEVVAFQEAAGEEFARLGIVVESDSDTSRGALAIRRKLVELHEKLLGVTVTVDSPEVETAFRLFVEVWDRKRRANGHDGWGEACDWTGDQLYFEGIADDVLQYDENGHPQFNWDRVVEILDESGASAGQYNPVVRTWIVVLAYFLTDYRYLFL